MVSRAPGARAERGQVGNLTKQAWSDAASRPASQQETETCSGSRRQHAVRPAAYIFYELTGCVWYRLHVTEAGRNESTAHLEQHFVHDYTPIQTRVVGEVPALRKFATPKSWKRNNRAARWVPSPVCCTGLQAPSTCSAKNCSQQCGEVTAVHRTELGMAVEEVWSKQGEAGLRVYLERLIDVREPNLETMAKHGDQHAHHTALIDVCCRLGCQQKEGKG